MDWLSFCQWPVRVLRCTGSKLICWAAVAVRLTAPLSAQELEPGAYWPIPVGLNVLTVANSFNWGDVAFDPAAPIDEASARINTIALSLTHAFSFAGRSANAVVVLPVVGGRVEGLYLGEPADVGRFGLGDPRLRFAVNLYGAPEMTPQAYVAYRQEYPRRRQPLRRSAARSIRSGPADQSRHQSLVVQA